MPVEGIRKVNEAPVVRKRPEVTSPEEEKGKKQQRKKKGKGDGKKRRGIVDIMA